MFSVVVSYQAAGVLTMQSVTLPTTAVARFAPDNAACPTQAQGLP